MYCFVCDVCCQYYVAFDELYLFVLLGCLYVDFKVRRVEGIILLTVVTGAALDSGFTDRYILFD